MYMIVLGTILLLTGTLILTTLRLHSKSRSKYKHKVFEFGCVPLIVIMFISSFLLGCMLSSFMFIKNSNAVTINTFEYNKIEHGKDNSTLTLDSGEKIGISGFYTFKGDEKKVYKFTVQDSKITIFERILYLPATGIDGLLVLEEKK